MWDAEGRQDGRVRAYRDSEASDLACSGEMNSVLGTEQVLHKC